LVASFDHLVGARNQGRGNVEAERSRRIEVDHQLDLVDRCTGKSAGFSPFRTRAV
jgi:hypothetical protein